ncbi:hypothetical protein BSL78_25128 [Apostichopus japonicus]|uniref:CxC1-like cysteine cluster associated with KDZ transposases domain-containing protein n=1 Tax=Stichopus japonicus TaxID=307972 RepID=A0A2G8JQJ6_STIJA|nr:hypothetical protein BSL78_25128 [Apostichopus japonicus]
MPPKKKIKRKRLVFTRKHINKDLSVTRIPVKFFPVNIPHVSTENVCDRTAPSTSRTPSMDHVAAEVRIEKSPSAAETEPTKKEKEVRAWQNIRRNVQTAYIESSVPSCTCCQGEVTHVILYSVHVYRKLSLVRCGYWPSSAKGPRCAIRIELLEWMRVLLLETQSSLRAICHSLQWKNYMSDSETAYLYRTLTHETFEEFRFFHYKTERLPEEEEGLYDDGSACPACPKEEVDDYVDQYIHRHLVRKNIKYAYPALLLKKLLTGSTLHHHVIYDIACKFDTHIKKNLPQLTGYDLALPVFHAYGHKVQCQVAYSTRWRKDYGLTDGEGMERLWSYLRKFAHITKEMTPSHRIDLLSDALRHFAMGKVCNQAASLCLCLQKCRDVAQKSNSEIQEICREFKTTVDDIKRWREEDKCAISKKKSSGRRASWKEVYVQNLDQYHQLCCELALCEDHDHIRLLNTHIREDSVEYSSISTELCEVKRKNILEKMRSQVVEYSYLKEISKKYSDGQAIAQRVGKQIKKSSASIKGLIQTYNGIFRLDQPITFAQVADLSNNLYHYLDDAHSTDKQKIPMGVKRKAVCALNMLDRANEEENITTKEMKNTIEFIEVQASILHNLISNLELHQPRSLKEKKAY